MRSPDSDAVRTRVATNRPAAGARILVLGAGVWHRRHYEVIRQMGHMPIAMDRNLVAPSRDVADAFVCADPSETGQVIAAARENDVDAILGLSEASVVAAAEASERLGLRQVSSESARLAHDKFRMRTAWQEQGIDQPRFRLLTSPAEIDAAIELGFPLIVKPRSLSAARGVRRVRTREELAAAYREIIQLSPDGVVAEEFIEGVETSIEGAAFDGSAVVLAYADKELTTHPTYRVTRSINYPGGFDDLQIRRIVSCAQSAVGALGLSNCPFHLEVFVTADRVLPIDCASRGGGGHIYSHIVEIVSGTNLVELAVELLLGERIQISPRPESNGACYRFLFPPTGVFQSVKDGFGERTRKQVVELSIPLTPGDVIQEPEHGAMRKGCVVTKGRDRADAVQVADEVEAGLVWSIL